MKKNTKKGQKETLDEVPFGWRVHTPNLLREIISGHTGGWIFNQPLRILGDLLHSVGTRAAEINDPELNALMARLTIYSVADPTSPDYDQERFFRVLIDAEKIKTIRVSSVADRFIISRISRAGITEGYVARCKVCGGAVARRRYSKALYTLVGKPGFNCKICVPYADTEIL
jgi:hypothetical protein